MSSFNIKINIDNLILDVIVSDTVESISGETSFVHAHHCFELHYVHSGNAEFDFSGEKIQVGPGELCLIAPKTYHSVTICSENAEKLVVAFSLSENKLCKTEFDAYSYYREQFFSIDSYVFTRIEQGYMNDLYECQKDFVTDARLDYEMFQSLFLVAFKKIVPCINGKSQFFYSRNNSDFYDLTSNAVRAMNAEYFMDRYYTADVTIDDLARYLNLSTRQTNRFLKEYMKLGFNEFIRKYRIELAKNFLKKNDVSVQEIANMVGYKSYNGFLKAFKTVTGETPAEFVGRMSDESL